MKKEIKEEISAGGVVYRKVGDNIEFLIGKHSGYHKWVLPKGMVEKGESYQETAEREVAEEVGVVANVIDQTPIKIIEYFYSADIGTVSGEGANGEQTERRVVKYQENGGGKVKIHKIVIFFMMEFERDMGKTGWEMEDRRWVGCEEGGKLLDFETEREVWKKAGSFFGK